MGNKFVNLLNIGKRQTNYFLIYFFNYYLFKVDARPLSIDTDQAMDQLVKLKKYVDTSVAELLNFLTPNWRMQNQIENINQNRSTFQVCT